ncbi:hypothetical protein [Algivirga pacifica]|uniref:Uncharacterized protein n=1 Tax=Algivirga pacifica TaxID=1162670 RepID=A0ABP9CZN7_9BACT
MQKSLYILLLLTFLSLQGALAQTFLAIDRYDAKRIKLYEGDQLWFKVKDDNFLHEDEILALKDSSVVMSKSGAEIPLTAFEEIRFKRKGIEIARIGTLGLGLGFLLSAAIEPAVSNNEYDAGEHAAIGAGFIAANLILRFFKWKKYPIEKEKARVQILDTTPENP